MPRDDAEPRARRATPVRSAGLLLYRRQPAGLEVFLIHMGGPFWVKKDEGAWSVPKGLIEADETPLATALREFAEETGFVPEGPYLPLPPIRQAGGKIVLAFAAPGDVDPSELRSNTFRLEWPPRSGRLADFPEADRAAWFTPEAARLKLVKAQAGLIDALVAQLADADRKAG
jgi:predicted NUDIX family NTP pyrophosphohydrolase